MRKALKKLGVNETFEFTARIEKFSRVKQNNAHTKTICLIDVRLDGRMVTDHVWGFVKDFDNADVLAKHQIIKFQATVTKYQKGYYGSNPKLKELHPITTDYCLNHFTNVEIIK